jgi:hypothetical protein
MYGKGLDVNRIIFEECQKLAVEEGREEDSISATINCANIVDNRGLQNGTYLNASNEMFERALRSEIYVDKSELIAFTNAKISTEQENICVSHPRSFGKSITANMLAAYYV